jgi:hypothetical protein
MQEVPMFNRRTFTLSFGAILLVAGCSGTTPMTPAVAVTDLRAALVAVQGIEPTLATLLTPAKMLTIDTEIKQGIAMIDGLPSGFDPSAQATTLQTVEGYLNGILTSVSSVAVPPPYDLYVSAAAVILPEIEAYISSLNPSVPPVGHYFATSRLAGRMSLEQARNILHTPPGARQT